MINAFSSSIPTARPVVPGSFMAKLLLPFAIPMVLTLLLILTIGETWPRAIAPGSGLKLAGLVATTLTAAGIWHWLVGGTSDPRVHRFAAIACAVTGLMGWPVWTVGVLPSINGVALGQRETVSMRLGRIDVSRPSKGPGFYYWAWLEPIQPGGVITGGRYFIPEPVYQRWAPRKPAIVQLVHATGSLGAEVVTGFE
ncbi:hypothetical protein [Sphingobium sp.]|uniref:hypothetical protein n=1 Tax=Sphingobium sp. TaxID=1912891 RepID=UPI002E1CA2D6